MNKQNLVNSNTRIWCTTALFSAALVCALWGEARSPQQQYIDLCKANYDSCVSTLCQPNDQVCESKCRADELTCFNNTINAIAPRQTPPPNQTGPNSSPTPAPS